MIGIPVTIQRDGKPEKIYLSTRRSGAAGAAMREAKENYYAAQQRAANALARVVAAVSLAESQPARLEEVLAKQEKDSAEALTEKTAALNHAEVLVGLALKENHGPDTDAIMDLLTDKQIMRLVTVIETGDVPSDFFGGPGPGRNASSSGQPAPAPGEPSSSEGTPAPTSTPAGSA